jgi:hypothetical protein
MFIFSFSPANFRNPLKVRLLLVIGLCGPGLTSCSADSSFIATLYTSDSDKLMRYTDEGETNELCKWTVDLSSLPTFRQNASMPQMGGFYTGK